MFFNHCVARGRDPSDWLGLGHAFTSRKGLRVASAPPRAQSLRLMRKVPTGKFWHSSQEKGKWILGR